MNQKMVIETDNFLIDSNIEEIKKLNNENNNQIDNFSNEQNFFLEINKKINNLIDKEINNSLLENKTKEKMKNSLINSLEEKNDIKKRFLKEEDLISNFKKQKINSFFVNYPTFPSTKESTESKNNKF